MLSGVYTGIILKYKTSRNLDNPNRWKLKTWYQAFNAKPNRKMVCPSQPGQQDNANT